MTATVETMVSKKAAPIDSLKSFKYPNKLPSSFSGSPSGPLTGKRLSPTHEDKKIIIHNAEFDLSHLNNELSLIGKNKINSENIIDTLEIAREKFPGAGVSLDALCKRYRIDNSKRKKHTALIDCDLLAKVYINLIDQREPTLDFQSKDIEKVNLGFNNVKSYFKKVIKPTSDEIKLHKDFLKTNLRKNNFN